MSQAALSILAHPDDAEFLCAGTLIRLRRDAGWDIHIATMTAGDLGTAEYSSEEIARIRRSEGAAAAEVIGARYYCLEERDLRVFYTEDTLAKATLLMRQVRPQIVFTHSPQCYMLDHEMTSQIVRAACFAAPVPNYLPGVLKPLEHIPHLYYCDPVEGKDAFGHEILPGFCIDIGSVIETKAEMLARHASQRNWLIKHHGMDNYIESMRQWSAHRGGERAVAFAEGFRQHLGHSYPQDNLLAKILGWI